MAANWDDELSGEDLLIAATPRIAFVVPLNIMGHAPRTSSRS
jgi:hypothetical protein